MLLNIGLNKFLPVPPKSMIVCSPRNRSPPMRSWQLSSADEDVLFTTSHRAVFQDRPLLNRKQVKGGLPPLNQRRILGRIIRQMDTYGQTETEASFFRLWKGWGDRSLVVMSFLTAMLMPLISYRTRRPSSITLVPTPINTWSLLLSLQGCTKAPSHTTRITLLSLRDSHHYDVC